METADSSRRKDADMQNANAFLKKCVLLFHKKSFLTVVWPIHIVTRIFGLISIRIWMTKSGRYEVGSSTTSAALSYFVILTALFLTLFNVIQLRGEGILGNIETVFILNRLVIAAVLLINFLRRSTEITDLLRRTESLDVKIPGYYCAIPIIIDLTYVFAAFMPFNSQLRILVGLWKAVMIFVLHYLPTHVVVFASFLYACKAAVFVGAINDLNNDLSKWIRNLEGGDATDLRPIIKRHMVIREICREDNEVHGLSLLLTMFALCADVSSAVFAATYCPPFSFLFCLATAHAIIHLIPGLTLVSMCQAVQNTEKETISQAAKIKLNSTQSSRIVLEQIRELKVHLRQLPIKLTAKGLFDLNNTLSKTMISTIVTYTVILLQNVSEPVIWDALTNATDH